MALLAYGLAAAVAAGSVALYYSRRRADPLEKEKRRRAIVCTRGRVIEGYVTSCENSIIEYTYHWRGITKLRRTLPIWPFPRTFYVSLPDP